jgi:hypothetical protein
VALHEIARHTLAAPGAHETITNPAHAPGRDDRRRYEQLAERFAELGPDGPPFFDALVRERRYGKDEAQRILALLATYTRADLVAALARARRYRAYSLTAIERILAAQAQPKPPILALTEEATAHLRALVGADAVPPRSTADYLPLLEAADGPQDEDDS